MNIDINDEYRYQFAHTLINLFKRMQVSRGIIFELLTPGM